MKKIIVDVRFYSCEICFLIDWTPEEAIKAISPKNRTKDITQQILSQTNKHGWLVCREWDDLRRQFCYIRTIKLDTPLFYEIISHEIYHMVNNICKLVGLEDDWEGNEHIAYLIWYITGEFYAWLFGYKKMGIKI